MRSVCTWIYCEVKQTIYSFIKNTGSHRGHSNKSTKAIYILHPKIPLQLLSDNIREE